jgi:hypothetical protein
MQRAGLRPNVESVRAEQVVWGGGGATGLVLVTLMWLRNGGSAVLLVLLVFCAAGVGTVVRDQMLTRSANKRERQMLAEFPTVAELLALAVVPVRVLPGLSSGWADYRKESWRASCASAWPMLRPEPTCQSHSRGWQIAPGWPAWPGSSTASSSRSSVSQRAQQAPTNLTPTTHCRVSGSNRAGTLIRRRCRLHRGRACAGNQGRRWRSGQHQPHERQRSWRRRH